MGALGLPELIVVVIVALAIFMQRRTSSVRDHELEAVSYRFVVPTYDTGAQTKAQPSTSDTIADLFGLGSDGLRWLQIAVVTVGTWISGNAFLLADSSTLGALTAMDLARSVAWPVLFVCSALLALRRWENPLAIACFGGAIYAVLGAAFVMITVGWSFELGLQPLVRTAASSFISWALSMLAIVYAASGGQRWLRMVIGLAGASIATGYVTRGIYGGSWDVDAVLAMSSKPWVTHVASSGLWTASFWAGCRFARSDRVDRFSWPHIDQRALGISAEREPPGVPGLERFLPAGIMAAVTAFILAEWDMGLEWLQWMTMPAKITGLVLPCVAAALVAAGARSAGQRLVVIIASVVSFTFPVYALYQIMEGFAATGSSGLGAISAGLSEALLLIPFVLAAAFALALVTFSRNSAYKWNLLTLLAAVGVLIVVDLLTMRDFAAIAAVGSATPETSMWTTRWIIDLLRP